MTDHSTGFRLALVINLAFLCCCAAQLGEKGIPPVDDSQKQKTLDPPIVELKRLYEAAESQYERRAIILQAIDEGAIQRGRPVSDVDAIVGTHAASDLPRGQGATEDVVVYFAPKVAPTPRADGATVAMGYTGWSMVLKYDNEGKIQNYYLTNLWKRRSNYEKEAKGRNSILEFKGLYENAKSERERRAVCLRAIDEGVIQTYRPVSPVDEIFGTHFASDLPGRRESIRRVNVDFGFRRPTPHGSRGDEASSWVMVVEYDFQGTLLNYYLTNIYQ